MDKTAGNRTVTSRAKNTKSAAQKSLPSLRVACYLRVSTEDQAESGLGIAAQRTRCYAMAEVKGWPRPIPYSDEGISGTKEVSGRPSLRRLLEDVHAGNIDAVIILSLDRLGRKTRLVLDLVEELTAAGVNLISCKESLDTSTPQGQFVLTMFAALAQLERDITVQRTTDALAERGKRDGEKGGRVPYGYRRIFEVREEKRVCVGVEIDEEQAKVVKRIISMDKRGLSLREIASRLNEQQITGPRGGKWYASSVDTILKNLPMYRGGKRGASQVRWPAILKAS
jgi:site-specific DNA recombinase